MSKKLKTRGMNIIGIDETNNRFTSNRYKYNLPMVVAGYLSFADDKHHIEEEAVKGGVFRKIGKPATEVLNFAKAYLMKNSHFYYCCLRRKDYQRTSDKTIDELDYLSQRARAISAIVFRFFTSYKLSQDNTVAILDKMDFKDFSENVISHTKQILEIAGISNLGIIAREKADKQSPPVRKADRVAYCICSIIFKGMHHEIANWTKGNRQVGISNTVLKDLSSRLKYPTPTDLDDFAYFS
ncbi:hypothetical protein COV15_03130 [Candidatus Woesearchaeota archaeon CG10_big_fil_rev_8_21_14_0_10_34_12]|nr:MAG: hypothetical protein COV15_03130 [Candidatus Woesearchaeota archaeon CG10_big_fil_rev_8_21_14_0_10_34_12]